MGLWSVGSPFSPSHFLCQLAVRGHSGVNNYHCSFQHSLSHPHAWCWSLSAKFLVKTSESDPELEFSNSFSQSARAMSAILDENESCFKKILEKSKFILLFSLKRDSIGFRNEDWPIRDSFTELLWYDAYTDSPNRPQLTLCTETTYVGLSTGYQTYRARHMSGLAL